MTIKVILRRVVNIVVIQRRINPEFQAAGANYYIAARVQSYKAEYLPTSIFVILYGKVSVFGYCAFKLKIRQLIITAVGCSLRCINRCYAAHLLRNTAEQG